MYNIREVCPDVMWVGGSDRRLERFENLFPLPEGITYNSYLILDEKVALMDAVDASVATQFHENLDKALGGRTVDYLVVHHVEPDHCSHIQDLCSRYPNMKIVGNLKTFQLMRQFFECCVFEDSFQEVKEGDELSLGRHTLRFFMAPMVHWPEVMFSYDASQKVLFTADAFGTFGAFSGNIFNDEMDFGEQFLDEARRYYTNIVGKYGAQVQAILSKVPVEELAMICPLHGPIWRNNLEYIIDKYQHWSTYTPEEQGVVIAYGSMYGHTENAAQLLGTMLAKRGIAGICMFDLSKTHVSYAIAEIFRYSHLVLAAPTYNMGLYLPMETLMHDMAALNIQNRAVALIGNGSWAPVSQKLMQQHLEEMKNMTVVDEPLVIRSALKDDQLPALEALADKLAASIAQAKQS